MLLPHGFEGQGPEHSNAYLERYLAACAEENIQVCNLTSPAQYFHALRRQINRNFRRPLIIMTPKSLLRHPQVISPVSELRDGCFRELIGEAEPADGCRRLVLCSGKLYYDLWEVRREQNPSSVDIVRVEQFYPVNRDAWREVQERYRDVSEVVWAQEEPANRGGWTFIHPYLTEFFPSAKIQYAGRSASASPATGSPRIHRQEQEAIVRKALAIE